MKIKLLTFFIFTFSFILLFNSKISAKPVLPDYSKDSDGIWKKLQPDEEKTLFQRIMKAGQKKVYHFADCEHTDCSANIMFTGDLMCLAGQQFSAETRNGFDFDASYSLVAPFFNSADLVCGNLETLISPSNPLTKVMKNIGGSPQCNGPEAYLKTLRKAGFDYFATANNHCCDWGTEGIAETTRLLDKYGFAHTGTSPKIKDNYVIFEVNGIRIAILSYTHIINQRGKLTPEQLNSMVSLYSEDRVSSDIKAARSKGADFIAVYCHWGIENTEVLTEYQKKDSLFIANSGADLIIGSHPHCLQGKEILITDDNRKVPCMYSMGNFVSSMVRDINNDTIILDLRISKNLFDNKLVIENIDYIPCHVMPYNGASFCVVPTSSSFNGGITSASLEAAEKRIRKIIGEFIL